MPFSFLALHQCCSHTPFLGSLPSNIVNAFSYLAFLTEKRSPLFHELLHLFPELSQVSKYNAPFFQTANRKILSKI